MIYWELFLGFLEVGCFAFGGGYGAIPLIRDVVTRHGWLSDDALTYMIAVSESTPGPIMVNMATYVGSRQGGLPGALLATAAVVLPSFLIILLVLSLMRHLLKNRFVQAFLNGMKPCVTGIILATGISLLLGVCLPSGKPALLPLVLLALLVGVKWLWKKLRGKKMSPILLILISAALGIALG